MIRNVLLMVFSALVVGWLGYSWITGSREEQVELPETVSYNFHIRPILADKCFVCHGPDKKHQEAGLRLDIASYAYAELKESPGAYAIIPGDAEHSEMYRRIIAEDPLLQMPAVDSNLGKLSEYEIQLIKKWINQGAKYEAHWAFQKPAKSKLPSVKQPDWPRNEIDYFILGRMNALSLKPNPEASKEMLLKRAALDITGLPPTLDQMDEFLADNESDAYESMVDKLLSMPQYGEKMAVHWLDVARYSDSYGYQDDNIRTQWAWRDWVIHAFNMNMPYDTFITWQLAGDMLPQASKEQILATAFLRNHKYTEEGGVIPEEYRIEYILDKTKTFSKGILGLTMECAQCHDHKYDPFSQQEYYQLFAFFNNTREVGYEGDVTASKPAKNPILTLEDTEIRNVLNFINKKDTSALLVSVMGELDTPRKTFILNRGQYDQPGNAVSASAPKVILDFDTTMYEPNRLGLAKWTVDKNNPMTARVFVNQIWQEFFGQGLVKTSGDFGMQGSLPSHPELLDWLAVDFMENGWDIKRLVRQIVLSSTYRQSAVVTEKKLAIDPDNVYLSRAPRLRIKAEFVRDLVLATSGLLVKQIGGPSVKPYQPENLWESATSGRGVLATYEQDHHDDLYRRGMYTFIKLTVPPPSMGIFDASNRDQCEVSRLRTSTPLQSLVMMNDPTVLEASRVFAQRLLKESIPDKERIEKAFRTIICRQPNPKEMQILADYFQEQKATFADKKDAAVKLVHIGESPVDDNEDAILTAALMNIVSVIYNMEEAITKT